VVQPSLEDDLDVKIKQNKETQAELKEIIEGEPVVETETKGGELNVILPGDMAA